MTQFSDMFHNGPESTRVKHFGTSSPLVILCLVFATSDTYSSVTVTLLLASNLTLLHNPMKVLFYIRV